MSFSSLRGLARTALQAKNALPARAGAGAPVKLAPRPDKPLPTWYELWWDNGFYPGQPVADFMFGAWPSNLTETYYLRFWAMFGLALAAPFYYVLNYTDELRMPMVMDKEILALKVQLGLIQSHLPLPRQQVPPQYPPEVGDVLKLRRNSMLKFDFSDPEQAQVKARAKIFWTPMY
ncbi:hypothetical protein VOLCADRAFT_106117 [Volvox carteri f. nagariensis]|uniref:Uncharacterized protein n=1 Tax=Volvox carteri f. nagariensis TaxID=3068 RepID=D8U573_VOLCA|nr:uncharacterized protein VOLCADRAFT_106117 [Volvox carteri f. nagariensis]EFJ45100.1 hypothetical protein VOLCADRAFT_106117 [Volvox carteri f. nagariensis]|eukprot:XP_002953776.1 hypothetical protein VOLCADRAFT_106117 [Volvox carteri f. nagariensis]